MDDTTKKIKQKCKVCKKKLGIVMVFDCKCGGVFCAEHRYAYEHACTWDHKGEQKKKIEQNNPLVVADKVPDKI